MLFTLVNTNNKTDQSTSDEEKSIWGFLKVKFAKDDRLKILDYLELRQFLRTLPELPIEKVVEENSSNGDESNNETFFDAAANREQQQDESSTSTKSPSSSTSATIIPIDFPGDEKEQMITKALLVGDHNGAVECCLRLGRCFDFSTHNSGNSISVLEQETNKDLQYLIEKVSIFRSACNGNNNGNNNALNQVLSMKYAKYEEILASQGNLSASLRYLAPITNSRCKQEYGVLFDRVYHATTNHQGSTSWSSTQPIYQHQQHQHQHSPQQQMGRQNTFDQQPPMQNAFNQPPTSMNPIKN
ncbi:hypothetical protein ACTA71_009305 [Dictyostelium dimigraforme]